MDIPGADGLIRDFEAPLILLAICLVLMSVNRRFARQSKSYLMTTQLVLTCMLLTFVWMLCALMYQDRGVLRAIWSQRPVFYSFVYISFGILAAGVVVAMAYWKLRPDKWSLVGPASSAPHREFRK
jgi:hypothetical protein